MSFSGREYIKHPHSDENGSYYAYKCGHCQRDVSGIVVALYQAGYDHIDWLICPSCGKGSVHSGDVFPRPIYGLDIEGLPTKVFEAYQEARNCMSVSSYISCELICRNILMYVAVEKGAKPNLSFVDYLSYLEAKGYITATMKEWVSLIREHGNDAAHDLELPNMTRAECTFMFTLELLRLVYEMNHVAKRFTSK
jgi:hypothetical protein